MERKDITEPSRGASKMERIVSINWVLFGAICMFFYGYVALDYDSDPSSCIATEEYDKRVVFEGDWSGISIDEDKYIDVGERFGRVFDVAYYASICLLVSGLLHMVFGHKYIRLPARTVSVIAQWALFVSVVAGVISRFVHSGRVCSGDYLDEQESTEGYMVTQGSMLAVILYSWATLMGFGLCAALVAFFIATS